MIEIRRENGELAILVSGNEADILDAGENYILAARGESGYWVLNTESVCPGHGAESQPWQEAEEL